MPWINLPGVTGKVYAPSDGGPAPKKHPCPTCFACQWCDEARCQVCRSDRLSENGDLRTDDREPKTAVEKGGTGNRLGRYRDRSRNR